MSKSSVYRIGDHVSIVRPIVVRRVGYPFDLHAEAARILREHTDDIFALLHKIDPAHVPYQRLGGRNRQLWTEEWPDLAGRIMTVKAKHMAYTGTYYPPGYDGDYDYEPGGLTQRKSHLLLDLTDPDVFGSYAVTIEAINVEPAP